MVATGSIIALIVDVLICFGIPLGIGVVLFVKKQKCGRAIITGAVVFVVSQLLLRLPITDLIMAWPPAHSTLENPWGYGLFLGLTAGIFEELGRYVGYRTAMKDDRRYIDGFAFGLGHGGVEIVFMLGFASVSNLITALQINQNGIDWLTQSMDSTQAQQYAAALVQTPWWDILLSGVERIFSLVIQIALSILVLYAVRLGKKGIKFLLLAIGSHLLIDAPLPILLNFFHLNNYIAEAYVAVTAIAAVLFILYARRLWREPMESSALPNPSAIIEPSEPSD